MDVYLPAQATQPAALWLDTSGIAGAKLGWLLAGLETDRVGGLTEDAGSGAPTRLESAPGRLCALVPHLLLSAASARPGAAHV